MRVPRSVQTIVLFFALALPAMAQSTGANMMSILGENLRRELTQYTVEGNRDVIRILDRESGTEIFSVREVGPQSVAITATVGTYAGMNRESRSRFLERIALFNFSSDVGTLTFDDKSETVVMSHNLNPRSVPIQQMVRVASLCGDVARTQSQTLRQ